MVIDSQAHIWAANTPDRPWANGSQSQKAHPFGAQDLLAAMSGAGVDRAILVPPSLEGGRNDLCLAAARRYPQHFAVMGRLEIEKPTAPALLEEMRTQTGMQGVRLTFHHDGDRQFLRNGIADWFWPEAQRLRFPVMVHAPESLPEISAIAERHPRLNIIVDHMGFARETMDQKTIEGACRMAELATLPNVYVKVSALPCYSTKPYPYGNIHAALHHVIDAFGASRCMWGADLTRLPQNATYRQSLTVLTEELGLSSTEIDWITSKTLLSCIGWPS